MEITVYRMSEEVPQSDLYKVTVRSVDRVEESFVHITRCPEQKNPREKILPLLYGRTFSWTSLGFTGGPVELEITKLYGGPARGVEILPSKEGIAWEEFDGHSVKIILDRPVYLSVRFLCEENTGTYGQILHGLMLFADEPEEEIPLPDGRKIVNFDPDASLIDAEIIYFGPGVHDLTACLPNGMLPVSDGQSVYLHGEAFVYGGITGPGSCGIRIYGRGTLCGRQQVFHYPGLPQLVELEPWDYRTNTHRGCHCSVEGVTLLDSFNHNLAVPPRSLVKNVKFIAWKVNNDGLRSGDGSVIDHVFMKVSDDHLYAYSSTLIRRSLFWPMWNGAILQTGWGEYGGGGTRFINNDIINPEWNQWWYNSGVLASQSRPISKNGDILIDDLRVDGAINSLVNLHFSSRSDGQSPSGGWIRDITLRNINVRGGQVWNNCQEAWYDEIAPDIDFDVTSEKRIRKGKSLLKGFINDKGEMSPIENICFDNVRIGGELLCAENLDRHIEIDRETTEQITVISSPRRSFPGRPGFQEIDGYAPYRTGAFPWRKKKGTQAPGRCAALSRGWLGKGASLAWSIFLPARGIFDVKASVLSHIHSASFTLSLEGTGKGKFIVKPIKDNGYTIRKIVCFSGIELERGEHRIILKGTDGFIRPDYVEITPREEKSPQVDVRVSSVSVMITEGDDWTAAGLNLRIDEKELRFNSRRGVAINPDERGPGEPLLFNRVALFDQSGNPMVSQESENVMTRMPIPKEVGGMCTALFTDKKKFWIARFFLTQ